jgi:hypothetical protein
MSSDADSAADLAGYEVVWRESTTPEWERAIPVGNHTEVTLDTSKDNVRFGVRTVDRQGRHSSAGFPAPAWATTRGRSAAPPRWRRDGPSAGQS